MAIDPGSNLFKAILAMDSYNRGYNAGIDLRQKDENDEPIPSDNQGIQLGAVTIYDSIGDQSAQTTGFYAIAYQYVDANNEIQTVISYRGTDQFLTENGIGGDIVNGYGVGAGDADVAQSRMAIEFYKAVAAQLNPSNPDPYAANIQVTGHSMGGGFAAA